MMPCTDLSSSARHHSQELQRNKHHAFPPQIDRGFHRILQRARGRINPRQLRHHLRAAGRDDGLRLPADDRDQDSTGVNSNGNVLRNEILGSVKMRCYLSGMPELRLGLNDKIMFETAGRDPSGTAAPARGKAIEMEDVKFHQCVRLSRFENDRTISFIPPDGDFELMSYRLQTVVKPLIWVEAVVENYTGSRVEYMVKAKTQFKRRSSANNVEICIPVSDDADTPKFRVRAGFLHFMLSSSIGSVSYAPERSALVWKIKQFQGGKEFLMRAHFGLPSVKGADALEKRPPISIKFEIPYFTVSGIQVRYLKIVEKSGYQALPWVRYITQHGGEHGFTSRFRLANVDWSYA
ncbi:Mu homology domain-containing protein [Jimgerdemannia flammicorona]|uniref:Mu homology domain-containing protein n=1 Tax=Jimgerdemannia flammicorona TaxID=994334 RepID=A0A433CY24_9FUNG|nr:Mu homology domain-containing protein [Jimgerdemannia flammicorona]